VKQLLFPPSGAALRLEPGSAWTGEGLLWLDVERGEADWLDRLSEIADLKIHDRHVLDANNGEHPPFYDGTDAYDMLVLAAVDPDADPRLPLTRPVACFASRQVVLTVRPSGVPLFEELTERLLGSQRKPPSDVPTLLHLVLARVIDPLLGLREPVARVIGGWEAHLLHPEQVFSEWQGLLALRNRLGAIAVEQEMAIDALTEWRGATDLALEQSVNVRFNDLQEHLARAHRHMDGARSDIDALVQVYFSAASQRTNRVMQFLAAISAIFLPLNLVVGFFGMNFEYLPGTRLVWAIWLLIPSMLGLALGLAWWFRRKGWL